MKLINNNLSPLPFYDNIALQNHRKDYAFGQIYPLITYRNMLLPFQFCASSGTSISEVVLRKADGTYVANLKYELTENGLTLTKKDGFIIVKYPGILPVNAIKHEGQYYIWMRLNAGPALYSEVFTVSNNIDDCLLLEYSNPYNFTLKNGIIDFSDNFKFRCYLNTQIGKPEYSFEEEVTERMGYSFIESQVSKKVYKFTFLAPEYLCDALRIVRLCENKRIISKQQTYDLTTFNMEPEWEEQGDLAAVECSFETDTVIANIGGYKATPTGGTFNSDFNNDFDIE